METLYIFYPRTYGILPHHRAREEQLPFKSLFKYFMNILYIGVYLNFILKKKKQQYFVEVGLKEAKWKKVRVSLLL